MTEITPEGEAQNVGIIRRRQARDRLMMLADNANYLYPSGRFRPDLKAICEHSAEADAIGLRPVVEDATLTADAGWSTPSEYVFPLQPIPEVTVVRGGISFTSGPGSRRLSDAMDNQATIDVTVEGVTREKLLEALQTASAILSSPFLASRMSPSGIAADADVIDDLIRAIEED